MVHWSRMVRHAHPAPVVIAMTETACEVAETAAHELQGDFAAMVVFLEVVKERARGVVLDEPATTEERETSGLAATESLLSMLRERDDATCTHSQATGAWGRRIAMRAGLPCAVTERITRAGILHDIGKIRVPDSILTKTGALSTDEWGVMRRHAQAGADILAQIPALAHLAPIVGAHHERIDGRGYPHGLRGDEISLETRFVSVADSFHAMISDRPYRRGCSYGEAITLLNGGRGTQWDAHVIDVMVALAAEDRNRSADANLGHGGPFQEAAVPAPVVGRDEDERQAV
jgi:HD-GYP domain-containing protein (c-di-GMP phosphodiesterase class II)